MFKLFIILAIIVAILLILIVLMQNSKGGGLSSQFGGSGAQQVIGVKKTTDLLEKVTWGFAIALLALSLSSSLMIDKGNVLSDPNLDRATEQGPAQTTPAFSDLPADSTGTGLQPVDTTQQD